MKSVQEGDEARRRNPPVKTAGQRRRVRLLTDFRHQLLARVTTSAVPRRQPHSYAGRNWKHRRRLVFASALSSADTVEESTDPVIRIRPPVANSISTAPACSGDGAGKGRAGAACTATATGLNATGAGVRLQSCCRHRNSWLVPRLCRG